MKRQTSVLLLALLLSLSSAGFAQGWGQLRLTNERVQLQLNYNLVSNPLVLWSLGGSVLYRFEQDNVHALAHSVVTFFYDKQTFSLELGVNEHAALEFGVRWGFFW
jgi:hypothetical protein